MAPADGRGRVLFRIAQPLRFLLVPRLRTDEAIPVAADGTSSLLHLVESLGIPRTEIGPLSVDRGVAHPALIPQRGQTIDVIPAPRPQPGAHRGFLLDVGLGSLARAMRLLGLDTSYGNQASDDELLARAVATGRILLTQDRRLLMRRALPSGALVRGQGTDAQLADVLQRFAPELALWTRCPSCNGVLGEVPRAHVAEMLQPGTRQSYSRFAQCQDCGQVYWHGAHAHRLSERIARAEEIVRQSRGLQAGPG